MCRFSKPVLGTQQSFDRLRLFSEGANRWSTELKSVPTPTGRMFFYVQVGSITVLALYDPGADVTLMKSSVFELIKREALGPINPAPASLSQACGAPVADVQEATVKMNIGGMVADRKIYICPSTGHDLIVGMPDINKFRISYDAARRKLIFAGQGNLNVKTSKVLKGGEFAEVECVISAANPKDEGLASDFTIGSDDEDGDLYVPPFLVRDYKPGDVIKVPMKNLSVSDLDLKKLSPSDAIGVTQEAKDPIPLSAFKIGDLPMPALTPCSEQKKKYLLDNVKIGPALPKHLRQRFLDLIVKKHQAFSESEYDLGRTDSYVHKIELKDGDKTPIFNKQFTLSEHALRFLREHIKELVRIGVLESSQSAWNSCCFVVPKSSGSYRMVIDLRSVNSKSIPVVHNGVNVDELIRRVGSLNPKVLSTADVNKGFWQIPLHPDSRELTSFNIPTVGSFRYTVAPMGASSSVYAFWCLMTAVIHGLQNTLCYLDDLITGSSSPEEHLEHLEKLFDRMIMHKLTLGIAKCSFFQEEVDFLGFEVTGEGMRPGAPKTEVIENMDPPSTMKGLRGFVGLTNYFSHHFPFQREAKYLTRLIRKESGWTKGPLPERSQKAFDRIKKILCTRPLLRYPDFKREFLLFTDASTGQAERQKDGTIEVGGLGAFLAQQDENGRIFPLGYAGRGLKKHEEAYSAFLLELAAALFGLEEFKHIIDRFPTRLFTDHQPLQAYSNPLSGVHRRTMTRLSEALMMQPLTIQYHPGLLNGVADTLSRIEYRKAAGLPAEEHPVIGALEDSQKFQRNLIAAVQVYVPVWSYSSEDIRKMQEADPLLSKVIKHVNRSRSSEEPRVLQAAKMSVINDQGLLFQRKPGGFKWGRYLLQAPDCLKPEILWHGHDSRMGGAHTGIERSYARIATLFVWDSMVEDISQYVRSCHVCQSKSNRNKPPPGRIREMPIERLVGARVHIDTYGELPPDEHGNKYILVFICAFSRYAKMLSVANKSAIVVARAFKDSWVCTFGVPLVVVSDNGTEYVNEVMDEYLSLMGAEHRTTSAYHPQSNAKVERVNATLRNYIRSYVDWTGQNWSECLPELNFSYNTSIHKGLKLSPFEVVFNYQPRFPGFETQAGINDKFYGEEKADLIPAQVKLVREFAASQSKEFQVQWSSRMNRFRKDPVYHKGDLVMFHDAARAGSRQGVKSKKFVNPWLGPCQVLDFYPKTLTVKVKLPEGRGRRPEIYRIHAERIKPYISRTTGKWIRGPGLEDQEGLPGGDEEEEGLRQLSKELRDTQLELDYDEDAFTGEGLEFIDRAPYTNKEDMVRWPGSRGHPIPQVEIEDPGMDPADVARHGTQGSLGNPNGTPATSLPREEPANLTPDRVVIRKPSSLKRSLDLNPHSDRTLGESTPRKRVRIQPASPDPIPTSDVGPARNTRSQAKRRTVACVQLGLGVQLDHLDVAHKAWVCKLHPSQRVEKIRRKWTGVWEDIIIEEPWKPHPKNQ